MKKAAIEKAHRRRRPRSLRAPACPTSLLVFLKVTVWLGPLLIALLGFDLVSGELQHKSVRFWTVRTRRWSYFAGKTARPLGARRARHAGAQRLVGTRRRSRKRLRQRRPSSSRWGLRFWLVAVVIAGAWAAIATFISSLLPARPSSALLTTFGTFFVMWLREPRRACFARGEGHARRRGVAEDMHWYEYLYPNSTTTLLLVARDDQGAAPALGILLGFVVVAIAAGVAALRAEGHLSVRPEKPPRRRRPRAGAYPRAAAEAPAEEKKKEAEAAVRLRQRDQALRREDRGRRGHAHRSRWGRSTASSARTAPARRRRSR